MSPAPSPLPNWRARGWLRGDLAGVHMGGSGGTTPPIPLRNYVLLYCTAHIGISTYSRTATQAHISNRSDSFLSKKLNLFLDLLFYTKKYVDGWGKCLRKCYGRHLYLDINKYNGQFPLGMGWLATNSILRWPLPQGLAHGQADKNCPTNRSVPGVANSVFVNLSNWNLPEFWNMFEIKVMSNVVIMWHMVKIISKLSLHISKL